MAKAQPFSTMNILLVLLITLSYTNAEGYTHDGGLWGAIKETSESIVRPVRKSVMESYEGLSDKGRFCVGMGVGFGCSRMVVGSTFACFIFVLVCRYGYCERISYLHTTLSFFS
jgi:hypothetical protein